MHLVLPLLTNSPPRDLGLPRLTPTAGLLRARRLQHPEALRGGDERTLHLFVFPALGD